MHFHGFPSMGCYNGKRRPAALIETFARFQAGFLSSEDFHHFLSILMDCWLAGLARLAGRSAWLLRSFGRRLGSTALEHARRSGEVGGYC